MDRFYEGRTYKWNGPPEFGDNWNKNLEAWKDRVPRKCLKTSSDGISIVEFEFIYGAWAYNDSVGFFVEVPFEEYHKEQEAAVEMIKKEYLQGIYTKYTPQGEKKDH